MYGILNHVACSEAEPRCPLTSSEKIDLCRGLFAFLVVLAHSLDISWVVHPGVPTELPPWLRDFLLYVPAAGVYWVIGFFVISGYCIQLSIERQVEGNNFSLTHYLLARVSRILPLYYLGLLFTVAVELLIAQNRPHCWPQGVNVSTFLAQMFIVQNVTQTYGAFAPSWSITNEMFYYVLYGGIVCLGLKCRVRPTIMGMGLCLALALLLDWVYFFGSRTAYVRSPGLLFGLGIIWFQGALVAEHRAVLRRSQQARIISASWPWILSLAMALWYSQRVHLQVVYLALGAAFTLMLIRFVAGDELESAAAFRRRPRPIIKILGLASYPTYLFHGPIVMLVAAGVMHWQLITDWRMTWLILSTIGIGSGLVLGRFVERPLMAWRAGYLNRLTRSHLSVRSDPVPPVLGI